MFQPELETLDRERLAASELERMRATLARCARNPAWQRRLGGARAEDLKTGADWARLPFLTKDELRDAYPLRARVASAGVLAVGPKLSRRSPPA